MGIWLTNFSPFFPHGLLAISILLKVIPPSTLKAHRVRLLEGKMECCMAAMVTTDEEDAHGCLILESGKMPDQRCNKKKECHP
jgi:hypothetical protein